MSQYICVASPAGATDSGAKAFLWPFALSHVLVLPSLFSSSAFMNIASYSNLMHEVIIPPTEEVHRTRQSASVSV